jgi:hypothetical protein
LNVKDTAGLALRLFIVVYTTVFHSETSQSRYTANAVASIRSIVIYASSFMVNKLPAKTDMPPLVLFIFTVIRLPSFIASLPL